jgi:hypothetical protein
MELICREALLAEYDRQHKGAPGKARELIVQAPTIEPKRGRWINYPECLRYDGAYCVEHIVCSNCESVWNIIDNDADRFDYCPHCGAAMAEGEEYETD